MEEKRAPDGPGTGILPVDLNHTVDDLISWLTLEPTSTDKFRAQNPWPTGRLFLFGGVTNAQCVKAAYMTLNDDLVMHSLHSYFISPGAIDKPTDLHVYMKRDGKSSATRQILAMQDDEVILSMIASFAKPKVGLEVDLTLMTGVAHPETLEPASVHYTMGRSLGLFDIRLASPEIVHDYMPGATIPTRMWFKTRTPVPNDPILHQCILTYASDLGTGFGDLHMRIMPTSGGPSLDHNLWFHHPVLVDDWFYLDQTPVSIAGGRGLYRGSIHDIKGKTCASMSQEMVIREQPHPDPNIPTTI